MADREGGGSSPWIAFLAGIILVALVAVGVVAYSGGFRQETAQLEINTPDIKVNPPDIDLPDPPPAPTMPPAADNAPAADTP